MSRHRNVPITLPCDIPGKRRYSIWGETFEIDEEFAPCKAIGKGAYGIVCSAKSIPDGREVAIKKIAQAFNNKTEAIRCLREVNLLRHLRHPDIISIYGIMMPANLKTFADVYVVYECMATDLHQIIFSKQPLSDDHYKYIMMQTIRGLKYLHSADIIHRDLKPSNLLLNRNCDLKIADFGLARSKDSRDDMTQYVVTRWYRAPELLLNSPYSNAIDMWSVGCILGELLLGEPLFKGTSQMETLQKIVKLLGKPSESDLRQYTASHLKDLLYALPRGERKVRDQFPNASAEAVDLLSSLLQYDPTRRPTAAEALSHSWFNDIREPSMECVASSSFTYEFNEDGLTPEIIRDLMRREIQIWRGMRRRIDEIRVQQVDVDVLHNCKLVTWFTPRPKGHGSKFAYKG